MISIRNINIGSGTPKICVSLASDTLDVLLAEAEAARASKADIAEWRADYFDTPDGIITALHLLRKALGDMPLLFTFRTASEGGMQDIGKKHYRNLNLAAASSGYADLIDVELFSGDEICGDIVAAARKSGATTVISSHDFSGTPPKQELISRLQKALRLGGDIPKLAVTPETPADVLTLLSAGEEFMRENPDRPSIIISMGGLGKISRVAGGFFGSCVTFASLERATAPGQLAVDDLYKALQILY